MSTDKIIEVLELYAKALETLGPALVEIDKRLGAIEEQLAKTLVRNVDAVSAMAEALTRVRGPVEMPSEKVDLSKAEIGKVDLSDVGLGKFFPVRMIEPLSEPLEQAAVEAVDMRESTCKRVEQFIGLRISQMRLKQDCIEILFTNEDSVRIHGTDANYWTKSFRESAAGSTFYGLRLPQAEDKDAVAIISTSRGEIRFFNVSPLTNT